MKEGTAFTVLYLKFCEFKLVDTSVSGEPHHVLWEHDVMSQREQREISYLFCVSLQE